jgi:hypothetical protein
VESPPFLFSCCPSFFFFFFFLSGRQEGGAGYFVAECLDAATTSCGLVQLHAYGRFHPGQRNVSGEGILFLTSVLPRFLLGRSLVLSPRRYLASV